MLKEEKMELMLKFHQKYKRWPEKNERYQGINIGRMVENARKGKTKILPQYLSRFTNLDFFEPTKKNTIHDNVLVLLEFFEKNDFWPFQNEEYNDIKIARFANKVLNGDIILDESDRENLQKLNFFEGKQKNTFHKKVKILLEFYNLYQRWPDENEKYKNINLGNLSKYIRKNPDSIYETDKITLYKLNFFKSKKCRKLHDTVIIVNDFFEKTNVGLQIVMIYAKEII